MECLNCKHNGRVQSEGHEWCTNCGSQLPGSQHWVVGFQQSHFPRGQVYNRRKRFVRYLKGLGLGKAVTQKWYSILDLYSKFEFCWTGSPSERTYFFAKPVMLKACCSLLGVEATLPGLKDKNREHVQFAELDRIRSGPVWNRYYGS